jgi:hypothetical protein
MKNALLIACALFYGFFPAVADFKHAISIALIPILLGLSYFVLERHAWGQLFPWLCACIAVGRIAAYWWLKVRHGRTGPIADQEVWVFGGLSGLCFAFSFWRRLREHNETPNPANGNRHKTSC